MGVDLLREPGGFLRPARAQHGVDTGLMRCSKSGRVKANT